MRVDIKSNGSISSQQVANVIDSLNEEYGGFGLRVKNLTCYVRFEDELGNVVEPVSEGKDIKRVFNFRQVMEIREGAESEIDDKASQVN